MSYLSPLLGRPGAVTFDGPDAGVAAHYGDPFREQRALAESCAVVDRSHRGVLRVPGADRLSWLHSLTTQHLTELADRSGTEALVLSPHGHVEHHLQLAEWGDVTWIDVEPGDAEPLLKFLDAMRFMLRVDPADVSGDFAVLSLVGPETGAVLERAGGTAPRPEWAVEAAPWGGFARAMPWPGPGATDLVLPRHRLVEAWDALVAAGAAPGGAWAWEAERVAVRRPRLGLETDHRTIPHEVGWLETAVHLDKGCYRGQETVARVHNLGRPPRRLVLLHLDGSADTLPPHGADVTWEGARVGFVTTSARHYEFGPVALALVKRSTPDEAALEAGGVAARVTTTVDSADRQQAASGG
jgi:folate-binding protein YgfZ